MFIAEVGINHNGDLEVAKQLIDVAVEAGADVVKFQKRDVDICVPSEVASVMKETPWGVMSYKDYKYRLEFTEREYDYINTYCAKVGIRWTASVWDVMSLNFVKKYDIPFIKVPSACITDLELLEKINEYKIPVIISTGMSSKDEIDNAIRVVSDCDCTILLCNSSYPSSDSELDLRALHYLKDKYPNCTIGYSGHEDGILPSIIAASLGAEVIERHITLDRNMWGTDQSSSLEPSELKSLINFIKKVPIWMGKEQITIYPSEEIVKKKLRRVK